MYYTPQQIGQFIKDTRKKMGVTQKMLALTSGTGLRFIVDLEKGKPSCHLGKTFVVLQTLGVQIKMQAPIIPTESAHVENP